VNRDELEAFFLNHDDPIFEQIRDAETEDEAEGIADDALADAGKTSDDYSPRDLIAVVCKIRES
jgi:hypothetical protein